MTVQAIETEYAGCRFRSRLEARWAVFFDALNLTWEYEPQGYDLNGVRYLPDFRLPDPLRPHGPGLHIEVKGVVDRDAIVKAVRLAAGVGPVLLVQSIPGARVDGPHFHYLFPERGFVIATRASLVVAPQLAMFAVEPFGSRGPQIPCDAADDPVLFGAMFEFITDPDAGAPLERRSPVLVQPAVAAGFKAARRARFEHGESGGAA